MCGRDRRRIGRDVGAIGRGWGGIDTWCRKRERMFIEPNVTGNVNAFGVGIKTPISMTCGAIAKENTRTGSEIHLLVIIWAKMRVILISKDTQKKEIGFVFK